MLEVLGEFATKDIKQMEDGLTKGNGIIDDIDVVVESAAEHEWIGIAFVLPLVFLAALLMAGAMAAQGRVMNSFIQSMLSWIVLPLFIVWIVLSYVLCAGLAISASANADFCSGGPDQTPDSTLLMSAQNAGLKENSIEYEITRFYLRQCTAQAQVDPFLFLRTHDAEIVSVLLYCMYCQKFLHCMPTHACSFLLSSKPTGKCSSHCSGIGRVSGQNRCGDPVFSVWQRLRTPCHILGYHDGHPEQLGKISSIRAQFAQLRANYSYLYRSCL